MFPTYLLTVIIPTLNRDKFLEFCLLSLIQQNYPRNGYEIIVVDMAQLIVVSKLQKALFNKIQITIFFISMNQNQDYFQAVIEEH